MKRALLIGASKFTNSEDLTPLQFPSLDVERLGAVLRDETLCAFDEVITLDNPSRTNALRALERMTRNVSERDDFVLFFYSGHGIPERDGSLALALPETESDYLTSTAITSTELTRLFRMSRASRKAIFLDCCYSGSVADQGIKGPLKSRVEKLAEASGTCILTASSKFEPAFESVELGGSAFTLCLINGITTGSAAPLNAKSLTLGSLASFVKREVPKHSNQIPQYIEGGSGGDIEFSKLPFQYDRSWAKNTRTKISALNADGILSDRIFDEISSVLMAYADISNLTKLRFIDDFANNPCHTEDFSRAWDRINYSSKNNNRSKSKKEKHYNKKYPSVVYIFIVILLITSILSYLWIFAPFIILPVDNYSFNSSLENIAADVAKPNPPEPETKELEYSRKPFQILSPGDGKDLGEYLWYSVRFCADDINYHLLSGPWFRQVKGAFFPGISDEVRKVSSIGSSIKVTTDIKNWEKPFKDIGKSADDRIIFTFDVIGPFDKLKMRPNMPPPGASTTCPNLNPAPEGAFVSNPQFKP